MKKQHLNQKTNLNAFCIGNKVWKIFSSNWYKLHAIKTKKLSQVFYCTTFHLISIFSIFTAKKLCVDREGLKDIVQPKKGGGQKGYQLILLDLYTIANVFLVHLMGYSHAWISRNRLQCSGPKTGRVFLMWNALYTKISDVLCDIVLQPMWRYDTSTAANVAVTTGGLLLLMCTTRGNKETKRNNFANKQQYSTRRYSYGGGSGSIVTWALAQYQNTIMSFWWLTSIKILHLFRP